RDASQRGHARAALVVHVRRDAGAIEVARGPEDRRVRREDVLFPRGLGDAARRIARDEARRVTALAALLEQLHARALERRERSAADARRVFARREALEE